jgi:hypothetical protein
MELRARPPLQARTWTASRGELQYPYQELGHVGEAVAAGQITGFRVGNQTMINDGQFVAEGFEALQHCELCGGIS